MDESKVKSLELAIKYFDAASEKWIEKGLAKREKEKQSIYLPDLITEIATKFHKYIITPL